MNKMATRHTDTTVGENNANPTSSDPLNCEEFDPYVHLNMHFPDAASLHALPNFITSLDDDLHQTNQQLRETVRNQIDSSTSAEENLEEARSSIQKLFTKVEEIRHMADESELMVKEICTEISSLDNAKRNLADSITTVKRLKDWGNDLEDLRLASDSQPVELDKAAGCIQSISGMIRNHFGAYVDIPRISEMVDRFEREKKIAAQVAIQRLKDADFSDQELEATAIIDACAVIDACGEEVRALGIQSLVQYNIEKYRKAFPPGGEDSRIERMERRLAWFRRLLKAFDRSLADNIPGAWCVAQELAVEYCLVTRKDVESCLQDNLNIEIIVKVIQKTLDFEVYLTQTMRALEKPSYKKYKYEGFITSCFETMLGKYVTHEDERMKTAMASLLAEEDSSNLLASSGGESGQPATLRAALGLFIYIRESLDKCTSFCNNATLVSLYETWTTNLMYVIYKL